ncbi:MAG: N-formylglutamate amidohydrolase [Polyangiales bacterium]
MTNRVLVLTCEHGGARVPPKYRHLFDAKAARRALASHRGSDLGALPLARALQRALRVPLYASVVTRLLVDLNRSLWHPRLLSEFSEPLDSTERAELLRRYYFPHRDSVESWIDAQVRRGRQVLHVGVHSFVPKVDGRTRLADVGILYDPSRARERSFCKRWKDALRVIDPELRVRRNYPYLGKSDGLVTALRRRFAARDYLGVELEANQALLESTEGGRRAARSVLASLRSAAALSS